MACSGAVCVPGTLDACMGSEIDSRAAFHAEKRLVDEDPAALNGVGKDSV